MNNTSILFAFITGLTTGGLSCYAVQGGLLTSSIASAAEKSLAAANLKLAGKKSTVRKKAASQKAASQQAVRNPQVARPILLFMGAKFVVHVLFGFLLGLVGNLFAPTPVARGILQLAVGLFMVGNALRMLNIHPIFRYFNFEPPHAVTRLIRRQAKNGQDWTTPVFLGALTLLIPCGVTQIMMATAVSTGNPWTGAALLGAFVLGASPAFFGVTYLAARLSALFEKHFMRALAVMILLLGLYSVDTGLNLAGSPFSITRAIAAYQEQTDPSASVDQASADQSATAQPSTADPGADSDIVTIPQVLADGLSTPSGETAQLTGATDLQINVLNSGYSPRLVHAPAGKPIHVTLVTKGVYSCSRAFVIPALNFQKLLPATGQESLDIPAQPAGTRLHFTCSMGMYSGDMVFE